MAIDQEASQDYVKTDWSPGMPITEGRMDKIEQGIYVNREAIQALDTDVNGQDGVSSKVTTLTDGIGTNTVPAYSNKTIWDAIKSLYNATTVEGQAQKIEQGANAWSQIVAAVGGYDELGNLNQSLSATLENITSAEQSDISAIMTIFGQKAGANGAIPAYTDVDTVYKDITNVRDILGKNDAGTAYYFNNTTDTVAIKMRDLIRRVGDAETELYTNSISGTTYASLADRLNGMANALQTLGGTNGAVPLLQDEITEAHTSSAIKVEQNGELVNKVYATLDERFEDIEGAANLSKTDIADIKQEISEARLNANSTLDARFDAIDGGSAPSRTLPNVISEINAAHGAYDSINARLNQDESNINHKVDTDDVYNDLDYTQEGKVLDARQGKVLKDLIDTLDTDYQAADNTLDTRLTSIEDELDDTRIQIGTDENTQEPIMSTLDQRLDSMDTTAAGIRADLNTIAGELAMMDNGALVTTNTRVDTLENDLRTMAAELNMLDGTSIVDTNSRVDQLANAISHAASGADVGGLTERIGVLESSLDSAETNIIDLDTRLDAIDGGEALTGNTLASRMGAAESAISDLQANPASTTEVISVAAFEELVANEANSTKDYLVGPDEDGLYKYYHIIETSTNNYEKVLISGGGSGTGSSSAIIANELPTAENANSNIDYYIGNNVSGYTHYRYIPSEIEGEDGVYITILPNTLINNIGVNTISVMTADASDNIPATYETLSGGLKAYTIADTQLSNNLLANFTALRYVRVRDIYTGTGDNQVLDHQELIFTDTNGNTQILTIQGGGGASAGSTYSARLRNGSGSTTLVYPAQEGVAAPVSVIPEVRFGGELVDAADVVINITAQWSLSNNSNSIWNNFYTGTAINGTTTSINAANILETGVETYIRVQMSTIIDEQTYNATAPIFSVSKVEMSIQALNFNPSIVRTGDLRFQYRTMGSGLQKEVHFLIDGEDAVTPVITNSHNGTLNQTIPLTEPGAHTFQVYFTVNGVKSNQLNYYILYNNDNSRLAPLIGLAAPDIITYGDGLDVRYTVSTIGSQTNTTERVVLELYNNSNTVLKTVEYTNITNEQEQTWALLMTDYPMPEDKDHPIEVHVRGTAYHTVDDVEYSDTHTIDIVINAIELPEGFELLPEGQENLVYSYTAYGRSNNDSDKNTYHYTYHAHDPNNSTINWTGAFNNFNWSTNGYIGDQALTISGGAIHTIDVPIFSSNYNDITLEYGEFTNCAQNGRTIEIEYEVQSATNLNDVIIDCMDNAHRGFRITPQSCYLLNSSTDIELANDGTGTILNESSIAAAYLSPNIRNHLVFVIEPWAERKAHDEKYHQSVNIYLNGEFANACPYAIDNSSRTVADDFTTNATMRIGSSSCIIKLYNIRMYNRGLTYEEVLHNYEVIPATTTEKLARFEYNNVLENGLVSYEKARKHFTCLLLKGPDPIWVEATNEHPRYNSKPTISPYKGAPSPIGRKDKTGEVVGKTESALTLTIPDNSVQGYKVEFDLQDKMSDGGYASSNNVQGTSSQKYPVHNLKIYLAKGKDGSEVLDENDVLIGYSQSSKVRYKIPGSKGKGESTLCWKADYMSTDHANTYNANIADSLYSQSLNPDITDEDWQTKVQNTVNGIRCLLFEQNGNSAPKFVADGCLNNDKGNSKTYGLEYPRPENEQDVDPNAEYDVDGTADTVAQKWEFTNNSDDLGYFKYDSLFLPTGTDNHYRALDAFESCYPDQGDLEDAQDAYKKEHDNAEDPTLNPNYNHLQILLSWVAQRANYWEASNTPTGETYTYNGVDYDNVRDYKKAIFKNEFTWHFNLDHTLIYYIFSQYIALCDNRVKNMFMRSDSVRKEIIKLTNGTTLFEGNNNPNLDFFKQFTQIPTGVVNSETGQPIYAYNMSNVNQIDWIKGDEHSNFAIWAPVLYDLDSCFGVENVGLLKIPYNADWQYQDNGTYLFNGHDSILWLMFEDSFDSEIRTKAKALFDRDRGLNYNTFYQEQIVDNQNETAPAMINQDMLLKYDAPWATGFINYSENPPAYQTPEYKYLQRGTRMAQKRSFISKRSMLLASKYFANEFLNNRISLRYGADLAAENAVLQIQGNQIFYPAASFGDNKGWVQSLKLIDGTDVIDGRVEAGQTCVIRSTSDAKGQDTLFIGGAKVLTDIGDLSPFKPYEIKLGGAVNLKRLIFGSDAPGYVNTRTGEAGIEGLSNCALLEEINIQNCISGDLTSLDLSSNGLIKRVYTKGSGIKYVSLPAGGVLTTLELSSNVENITIRNQSYFTTFTYQNAEINNYANVNKLWIENTPNVPIVSIVNNAMEHLTNGVRLINIDVDLGSDPFFLETITSNIAKNKHLDSNGSKISSIEYPEITGKVKITKIRESLLNKIKSIYKNLIVYASVDAQGNPIEINGNDITREFEINYYNYGYVVGATAEENAQWLLYTDHRTDQEHYIDPVSTYIDDLDPVTNQARISIPTKPEDAQYYYSFGEYDDDGEGNLTYIRFSGWKKEGADNSPSADDYVQGNITFIAQYPTTTDRFYTVRWYAEPNETAIQTITAKYGTDITLRTQPEENNSIIRAKLKDGVYKVFKGWNRPIGKLVEDTNIYAVWETSNIGNSIQSVNMNELTAADLYAIANIGSEARIRIFRNKLQGTDPIAIKMGNDFYYTEGVNTTDLLNGAEKIRLTGDSSNVQVKNNITPLANLASDWTIAIDYKFLMDQTTYNNGREFVLLSCYQNANSSIQGFKVSLNKGSVAGDTNMYVHVTWGTTTTSSAIDTITLTGNTNSKQYCKSKRNVIVLRHNAEEPENLYIYSTGFNSSDYSNTELYTATLTWTNRTTLNTPLIIGGNYSGTTTNIEVANARRPAKAMIYWAKYWDADLGRKNCRLLAAWPHETEYFLLTGYDNNLGDNGEGSTRMMPETKITFAAAQGFGDRTIMTPSISDISRTGWYSSSLRTLCNDRIYNAFPTAFRSVIGKYTITSTYFDANAAGSAYSTDPVDGEIETQDYIYLASEQEVGGTVTTTYKQDESLRFWPWLSSGNAKTLTISNDVLVDANLASISPLRYRFLGRPFTTDTTIFYDTPNPASVDEWTYQYIDENDIQRDEQISVKSGDVWYTTDVNINAEFNSSPNAYIYYTNAEINEGVYVDIVTTNGGWKRAGMWELRTYHDDGSMTYGNPNRFDKVNEQGALILPTSNNIGSTSTRILCPEFAI